MPKVSVIMPVYNGEKHISEAIESVIAQTMTDWDFWIINEFGSVDRSAKIVQQYAAQDSRIHLVQNETRLGLAESLNKGFRLAQGEYFVRLDADDLAHRDRFEKQVKLMDEYPQVGICGTYQHHFGDGVDWVHCPPVTNDDCRAKLLFNCDLCHSTLMLRRKTVLENGLFYDNTFKAEDFELWCRAMTVTEIINIPEVLGEYRWDGDNITATKKEALDIESGMLVATNLKRLYGMNLTEEECVFFRGWNNPFNAFEADVRPQKLESFEKILREIYKRNHENQFISDSAMLKSIARKWMWAKYNAPWDADYEVEELNQVFAENYHPGWKIRLKHFLRDNKTWYARLRKIVVVALRPVVRPIRNRMEGLLNQLEDHVCHHINDITWDRYQRLSSEMSEIYALLEDLKGTQAILLEKNEYLSKSIALSVNQTVCDGIKQAVNEIEKIIHAEMDKAVLQHEAIMDRERVDVIEQAEKTMTRQINNYIEETSKGIIQTMDSRIWKAEKIINQTTDSRIWKMERNVRHDVRAGFQNVYLANCLSRDNQNTEVSMTYDDIFYFENRAGSVMSARAILSTLLPHLGCRSMVDFGCGTGTWLWVAHSFGVESIRGLDGDYVPPRQLMIPQDCFCAVDLEEPVVLEKKYDLAISMEVAEHLHKESADTFVESLCNAADTILFSAAHPGQGGDGHINEQPMTYWTSKFGKHGFLPVEIRQLFEGNEDIESWYRENIVLYVREAKVRGVEKNLLGKSE